MVLCSNDSLGFCTYFEANINICNLWWEFRTNVDSDIIINDYFYFSSAIFLSCAKNS